MKHMYGNACQEVVPNIFILYLVKNDVPLRCIEKRSHALNMYIDTRTVYSDIIIIKTTQDTRISDDFSSDWFTQFYLHSGFYFLFKLSIQQHVHSVKLMKEPFWDCIGTNVFWRDWIDWLHTHFLHCSHLRLSKEFVILVASPTCIPTELLIYSFFLLSIIYSRPKEIIVLHLVFLRTKICCGNIQRSYEYQHVQLPQRMDIVSSLLLSRLTVCRCTVLGLTC